MHTNDVLFLLSIPKQDQEISPCSCSGLSLPHRAHVLVRCSHTVIGLRTLFLFLPFLDLLWNFLAPFTPYHNESYCDDPCPAYVEQRDSWCSSINYSAKQCDVMWCNVV